MKLQLREGTAACVTCSGSHFILKTGSNSKEGIESAACEPRLVYQLKALNRDPAAPLRMMVDLI